MEDLSKRLKKMSDEDLAEIEKNTSRKLSFWYWINGPLADILNHVGQITSWQRIAGNPQQKGVNVYIGNIDNVEKY